MNISDGNCFFFVNLISLKKLKISGELLKVVSAYQYNSNTIKNVTITEEDSIKFFKFFEKEGFYYKKYWMKYAVKMNSNDKRVIPKYSSKQEESIVKYSMIMILYLLEFRKIEQKNERRLF